jgi:hypothetical protein
MKVKIRMVEAGRYEGGGLRVAKEILFGNAWQVRRLSDMKLLGGYGSLEEALFHKKLEVVK